MRATERISIRVPKELKEKWLEVVGEGKKTGRTAYQVFGEMLDMYLVQLKRRTVIL